MKGWIVYDKFSVFEQKLFSRFLKPEYTCPDKEFGGWK